MQQKASPATRAQAPRAGAPHNRAELDALLQKRGELNAQVQSLSERRSQIVEELTDAPDAASRQQAQSKLAELDTRQGRIEQQVREADDDIADALGRGITAEWTGVGDWSRFSTTVPPPGFAVGAQIARIVGIEAVVFVLLGTVLYRWAWRRARLKFQAPAVVDNSSRLDQLQQSVDVIALEVERISEGQRYVAKILNEKLPAIEAGP